MGYSRFSIGDEVRIVSGAFMGMRGQVAPPLHAAKSSGTVINPGCSTGARPVTIAAVIDGHELKLRVPPELLERL
jgi:ribosomal protein L24